MPSAPSINEKFLKNTPDQNMKPYISLNYPELDISNQMFKTSYRPNITTLHQ